MPTRTKLGYGVGAVGAQIFRDTPALILPMVALFLAVRLFNSALAVLAALATGLGLAFTLGGASLPALSLPVPTLTFIAPSFRPDVLIGLGVPLYLVYGAKGQDAVVLPQIHLPKPKEPAKTC